MRCRGPVDVIGAVDVGRDIAASDPAAGADEPPGASCVAFATVAAAGWLYRAVARRTAFATSSRLGGAPAASSAAAGTEPRADVRGGVVSRCPSGRRLI